MRMARWLAAWIVCVFCFTAISSVQSQTVFETYTFATPTQEALYQRLVEELRCPKCQNQNLKDSNSAIAKDLRRELYRLVTEGQSEADIKAFMVQRYGEYVLYQPRLSQRTAVLWFAPAGLLLVGVIVGLMVVRNRRRALVLAETRNDDANQKLDEQEQQRLRDLLAHNESDSRRDD